MLTLIKTSFSLSLVHYPVRQWSIQRPSIIPKWFTLHCLRIRTQCLWTPHIHHLFCLMTAFQLPYSVPGVTHTPAAYHKPLKYNCPNLSPDSCWKVFQRLADKTPCWEGFNIHSKSNDCPHEEQCLSEEDLCFANWAFRLQEAFTSVFFFY